MKFWHESASLILAAQKHNSAASSAVVSVQNDVYKFCLHEEIFNGTYSIIHGHDDVE